MKKKVIALIIALAVSHYLYLLGSQILFKPSEQNAQSSSKEQYFCPMHPQVTSDQSGHCPICKMELQAAKKNILYYRHPMGKNVTSPVPMKDEMGMDFIPVYDGESSANALLDGRTSIILSDAQQQMIGVVKTKVEKRKLTYKIYASGRVAYDPELYTAIEEYKIALGLHGEVKTLASIKLKLKLLGLDDNSIRKIEEGKTEGKDYLLPKDKTWIYAEVFEYEIARLKIGQKVEVSAPNLEGNKFTGEISSISPIVNIETRTLRVRLEVDDSAGVLTPNQFVNATIIVDLGERLVIPSDAIIHTGKRDLVFIADSQGHFTPQEVELGPRAGNESSILSGLQEGDEVVSSANFLLDSESRIQAVMAQASSK